MRVFVCVCVCAYLSVWVCVFTLLSRTLKLLLWMEVVATWLIDGATFFKCKESLSLALSISLFIVWIMLGMSIMKYKQSSLYESKYQRRTMSHIYKFFMNNRFKLLSGLMNDVTKFQIYEIYKNTGLPEKLEGNEIIWRRYFYFETLVNLYDSRSRLIWNGYKLCNGISSDIWLLLN